MDDAPTPTETRALIQRYALVIGRTMEDHSLPLASPIPEDTGELIALIDELEATGTTIADLARIMRRLARGLER